MLAESTLPTFRSFLARFPSDEPFLSTYHCPFLLLAPADDRPADEVGPTEAHSTLWFEPSMQEWQLHVLESLVIPIVKRPEANDFSTMITVGRAANNDLVLSYVGISKFHAYFTQFGETWNLWDGKSRNGTSIQGQLIPVATAAKLRSKDLVHFGEHEARFLHLADMLELMRELRDLV